MNSAAMHFYWTRGLWIVCGWLMLCSGVQAVDQPSPEFKQRVETARLTYDCRALDNLLNEIRVEAKMAKPVEPLLRQAAQLCLWSADVRRFQRFWEADNRRDEKRLKLECAALADEGVAYIKRYLPGCNDLAQQAECHRLISELTGHKITGAWSALQFGGIAEAELRTAFSLRNDDAVSSRVMAMLLMFNPLRSGADLAQAEQCLRQAGSDQPDNDAHWYYLALALQMDNRPREAQQAAEEACRANTANRFAQALRNQLKRP